MDELLDLININSVFFFLWTALNLCVYILLPFTKKIEYYHKLEIKFMIDIPITILNKEPSKMDLCISFELTLYSMPLLTTTCGPDVKDNTAVTSTEEIVLDIVINNKMPRLYRYSYPIVSEDPISLWTSWSPGSNNFSFFLCCSLNLGTEIVLLMYQVGLSTPRSVVLCVFLHWFLYVAKTSFFDEALELHLSEVSQGCTHRRRTIGN